MTENCGADGALPTLGPAPRHYPASPPSSPASDAEKVTLLAILIVAFALRMLMATFLPNIHHPDEVFQYLEQGHRLAFGYGVVPWEYRDGIRSWLLPGFLGGLMGVVARLGGGAATYLAVIACVLSLFSTAIVAIAWLWARRLAGPVAAILAAAVTATWFELVYFGSKPLTEALAAATLFAAAFCLCSGSAATRNNLFAGGFLLALTFVLRLHLAPAILVVAILGCVALPMRRWLFVVAGGLVVVVAAGVLDWATWGLPFQSLWKNIYVNLLEDKASQFGRSPWYLYVWRYVLIWSAWILPMVVLTLIGARRAPFLLMIPLIIVFSHSLIGHKEFRFLFPAVPFVLLLAAIGTAECVEAATRAWPRIDTKALVAVAMLGWLTTSCILIVGDRFRPNLSRFAPALEAFNDIRALETVCGVGLVGVPWYKTGGYTYLNRNVPIYPVREGDTMVEMARGFDVAVSPKESPLLDLGFQRERCYSGSVCLYRRVGTCAAQPALTINQYLRNTNQ